MCDRGYRKLIYHNNCPECGMLFTHKDEPSDPLMVFSYCPNEMCELFDLPFDSCEMVMDEEE